MEQDITEQRFLGSEPQLAEPHFDEEATLLSARPVVPLERVAAKRRLTRQWLFGLAMAGALLLGVAATAIYYSRLNNQQASLQGKVETNDPGVPATQSSESASGLDESPSIAGGAAAESDKADTSRNVKLDAPSAPPASASTSPDTAAGVRRPIRTPTTVVERSNRVLENREERRAARKEARQRNRELVRERRASKTSDDLLRIREIFEGPPRP